MEALGMKSFIKIYFLILVFCINTVLWSQETIYVGISNRYGNLEKTKSAFTATFDALNKNSKLKWEIKIYNNDEDLLPALQNKEVQLIKMGPLSYALEKQKSPIQAIAVSLNEKGSPYYYSVIVVHKKSTITSLNQLKDKKVAFGSKYSTSSFLIPALYLERIGINLSDIKYSFLGAQPKILMSLINGKNDAGAVIADLLNNVKPGTFKILHRSEPIPGSPVVIAKELPQGTVDAITKDINSFNRYIRSNTDIQSGIEADFRYGFSLEVNETNFDPLRLAYKKLLPKIK